MSEPMSEPTAIPETPSAAPQPTAQAWRRRDQIIIASILTVIIIAALGAVWVKHRSATMTVTGAMVVAAGTNVSYVGTVLPPAGAACNLDGGYADLPNSQVVIADDAGHTLGISALGAPVFLVPPKEDATGFLSDQGTCTMPFTVTGVSKTKSVYTITVGRRGSVKFTLAEMEAGPILDIQ